MVHVVTSSHHEQLLLFCHQGLAVWSVPAATIVACNVLQDGSFGLLSRAKVCTAAGSLHTMIASIAVHFAYDHLNGVRDGLPEDTSTDVQHLSVVTDGVFITTDVIADCLHD